LCRERRSLSDDEAGNLNFSTVNKEVASPCLDLGVVSYAVV